MSILTNTPEGSILSIESFSTLLIYNPCLLLGLREWNPYHIGIYYMFLCVVPSNIEIYHLLSYSNTLSQYGELFG